MSAAEPGRSATEYPQRRAVFSLGSNLEDRLEALQGALDALVEAPGVTFVGVSPVYETAPVGGPDQPHFLNAVLVIDTALTGAALLERAQGVESAMQRSRNVTRGPRIIDVDVVAVGDETSDDPRLTLPHPRAHERAFVLVPWSDVDPSARLPGGGAVADMVTGVRDQDVRRRDDLPLRPPT